MQADNGRLVTADPSEVLRPRDAADVAAIIERCAEHRLPVAPRGGGHSCYGQSLVHRGVSIDMTSLNTVHEVRPGTITVDAGARWADVVRAAHETCQRPPALTAYLGLTVGGTLSVGGVSAAPWEGGQVERVRELEVVTGTGEVLLCSREHEPELFDAVRGGLGQFGVITRAVLDLVPAPERVHQYVFAYTDQAKLFTDARMLLHRDEVDELYVQVMPPGGGFRLVVCTYDHDDMVLPEPLLHNEEPWLRHVGETTRLVDGYRVAGWDERPKPWFDAWLPDSIVETVVADALDSFTAEDWTPPGVEGGWVLLFPHRRAAFEAPMLRVPERDDWVWLFDVLTVGPSESAPLWTDRMLARNQRLAAITRAAGGTIYPIGATAMSESDWAAHYGPMWERLLHAKRLYDPRGVLTPGPGVFAPIPTA
ncbi:FAD-linked oxidase [Lentzea sp. NBRC 105346]|uniref:FAD-binding protein n=1 Tax=Lentzea sp. NBRC 105346 TaxID=3032205 RepID=UPI0024A3049E|nr:FAD-binding protein [Lentzea sp. NBRC 105346]GLZ35575.1 FAD-linked oxidase [Lentzea sp. NBRC 105346]